MVKGLFTSLNVVLISFGKLSDYHKILGMSWISELKCIYAYKYKYYTICNEFGTLESGPAANKLMHFAVY